MGLFYDIPAIEARQRLKDQPSSLPTPPHTPPSSSPSSRSSPSQPSQNLPSAPAIGYPAYGFCKSPYTGELHWKRGVVTHHTEMPCLVLVEPIYGDNSRSLRNAIYGDSFRPATELDILNFQRGRFGGVEGKVAGEEGVGFWNGGDGNVYIGLGRVRGVFGGCFVVWVRED
ncbi:uncharacterized protein BDV14DRAFT_197013 [Aspergillus stella-maris]|uniref:uncharacterized protein n=1 Tax=Aspergillus stella-maris TaxID=1810926 RepID=UPI003CCD8279